MLKQVIPSVTHCFARCLLFASLHLGFGISPLVAQLRTEESKSEDQNAILTYKVSAITDSGKVQRGDGDVLLEAELKNNGTQPIDVYWDENGTSSSFQFSIVHEATGRPIDVSSNGLSRTPRPEVARITQFKSIAPGFSVRSRLRIGRMQSITAFFREPGRYVVYPSLVVVSSKVIDDKTKVESVMKTAWTGTIIAKPFTIEIPASAAEPSGDRVIVGTVVSADAQPVDGAIVKLLVAQRGASFEEDLESERTRGRVLDQASSAKGGLFYFVGVPNDADFLLIANHQSHGQQSLSFTFKEFMRRDQPCITFPKRITIRGKVVDSKGLPVSDVRVQEYGTEGSSSREDGSFQCLALEKNDSNPYRMDLWKKAWSPTSARANRQLATSGDWTIEMQTELEMTIRGRAVFADDTPLSKMAIQVELVSSPSQVGDKQVPIMIHPTTLRTETDQDGDFRFVMPGRGDFSGKVIASDRTNQVSRERRWSVDVSKLAVGQDPLELKFENRGQIVFAVFGTSAVPDSIKPTIGLRSTSHNYTLEWERTSVSTLGKVREYEGLAPGEYELSVGFDHSGIKSQTVTVSVPNSDPYQGIAKLQLPKIIFGSIQAKHVMPDNRTPAKHLSLVVYGNEGFLLSLKTDDAGGFQLVFLPIGDYSINVNNSSGISTNPILFSIIDDKPIDLEVVRLKAVEEEFGWFDGRIAYEGGASLGGVFVMNKFENDFTASVASSGSIPDPELRPSGDFHLRLPEGKRDLIFYLHGKGPSPFIGGSFHRVGREIKHKLIVNVDILAGMTTKRDFRVPLRQNCRDVTVVWAGMNERRFSIISLKEDRTRWIYSATNNSYKLDASGKRINEENFTFTGFPTGPAYVLADSSEYTERVFAIKSIPITNEDSSVVFNQEELSSIQISLVDANGAQHTDFSVSICALVNDEKILVTGLNVPSKSISVHGHVPWAKRLADGQVRVPNLGSGKYVVKVSNSSWEQPALWQRTSLALAKEPTQSIWEHSHEIDLAERSNLHLQFQIDSAGVLVDVKVIGQVSKD